MPAVNKLACAQSKLECVGLRLSLLNSQTTKAYEAPFKYVAYIHYLDYYSVMSA